MAASATGAVTSPSSNGYKDGDQSSIDKFVVHTDTVGQSTGLTDKTRWDELTEEERKFWLRKHTAEEWTGKLIFEGDIVQGVAYSEVWRGVIVWIYLETPPALQGSICS